MPIDVRMISVPESRAYRVRYASRVLACDGKPQSLTEAGFYGVNIENIVIMDADSTGAIHAIEVVAKRTAFRRDRIWQPRRPNRQSLTQQIQLCNLPSQRSLNVDSPGIELVQSWDQKVYSVLFHPKVIDAPIQSLSSGCSAVLSRDHKLLGLNFFIGDTKGSS